MASCLEGFYKENAPFASLMSSVGLIRKKWVNSKNIGLIPPNMRVKSRFLNLFEIVEWMQKVLAVWHKIEPSQQQTLFFLQTHKMLIEELGGMIQLVKAFSKELKTKGIVEQSVSDVNEIFDTIATKTINAVAFKETIIAYIEEKRKMLPDVVRILCCSDVIESYFGKFKNRTNQGTAKGITDDMIVMALFNGNLSKPEIKTALESVFLSQIAEWSKENTIDSFAKTKNKFWTNLGAKDT